MKVIHLKTNSMRALKTIEKKKIEQHEILMQLQQNEFLVLQETVIEFNDNLGQPAFDESV